ncbi:MAG TPA: hypothetical protein VFK02_23075 [Kofleriaceae bacterium]|nr:hypothetical protein [Kofleriaceae bacterium]
MAGRHPAPTSDRVWPRFSRYVIAGGYLRPAAGAKLSWYDPWEDFLAVRRSSASAEVAFDSLLRLLDRARVKMLSEDEIARVGRRHVSRSTEDGGILRPALVTYAIDEPAVLAWVAEHGLLGLLHHRLEAAHSYDRGVLSSSFSWSLGAWRRVENEVDAGSRDALRSTARDRGEPNESYAVVRPLAAPGAEVRLSDKAWAAYFPTLTKADLARVPDMLADGTVWPYYAESIDDFIGAPMMSLQVDLRGCLSGDVSDGPAIAGSARPGRSAGPRRPAGSRRRTGAGSGRTARSTSTKQRSRRL